MAISTQTKIGLSITFFGVLSFVLGIVAELKKPPSGTPIQGIGVVTCSFPRDPTVVLGFLSILTAIVTAILGAGSVLCTKDVPRNAFFGNRPLYFFYNLAIGVSLSGVGMMLWVTVTELLQHLRNVHHDLDTACPTAKTGLFGGSAFLHLDAALFWLVTLMLIPNVREDLNSTDEDEVEAQESKAAADYGIVN